MRTSPHAKREEQKDGTSVVSWWHHEHGAGGPWRLHPVHIYVSSEPGQEGQELWCKTCARWSVEVLGKCSWSYVLCTSHPSFLADCLAHSRHSINNCWGDDLVKWGCLVAHYDVRVIFHSEKYMFHKLTKPPWPLSLRHFKLAAFLIL